MLFYFSRTQQRGINLSDIESENMPIEKIKLGYRQNVTYKILLTSIRKDPVQLLPRAIFNIG